MAIATPEFPAPATVPQGAVPFVSIPDSWDYPRLVYVAPYFTTVPLAELIDPSVKESIESLLPSLVPPYVQDAANTAVADLAVVKTGSTMSGPLFLNGLPTQPNQAATMSYVDMMVATSGVPEVPAAPSGQTWGRQTGQWVAIASASGTFLPLSGGTMQGALNMGGNSITNLPAVPQAPYGAANMTWVLDQIAAQSLYQGTWNADNNTPDLTLPGSHQNEFSWIATTVSGSGVVVSQPIPGVQGLTIYNGDNLIYSAIVGQFQVIHAGGLSLTEADARYLMLTGGQLSGALLLNADPTQPMQAATRQFVVAQATFPEAPADGQLYGRSGLNHNWGSVLSTAGGVLTGALTLNANAVTSLNAVPLQQLTSTLGNYVATAGNATITGPITMSGAPATLTLAQNAATNLQAVPLQQLTSTLASYVPTTGGTVTGNLTVNGTLASGGAVTSLGNGVGAIITGVELGNNRTGDGDTYIDWHSSTLPADFEFRIIRSAGADGNASIINSGAGITTIAAGNLVVSGLVPTADAAVQLGRYRTGDGPAYLDLYSSSTGVNGFRLMRYAGANGNTDMGPGGTGAFNFMTNGGANRLTLAAPGTNGLPANIGAGFSVGVAALGIQCRPGTAGPAVGNQYNINWTGAPILWIDNTNVGQITITSDYRVKENVANLPSMWARVKALRPVSFTRRDNPELLSVADPAEQWGFVAHELQETLIASASTGSKDEANVIQSPNLLVLLAALTAALQEAMVRIEALEAVPA